MVGRKVEDFNSTFCRVITIVLSYVEEYLKKRSLLQNISKEKLEVLIIKKMQNMVYLRHLTTDK